MRAFSSSRRMIRSATRALHRVNVAHIQRFGGYRLGGYRRFGATTQLLSDIGEGIAEVELMQWMVSEGDKVNEFDPICTVQSDKATVDISSRHRGVIKGPLRYGVGDMIQVGAVLVDLDGVDGAESDPPADGPEDTQVNGMEESFVDGENQVDVTIDPVALSLEHIRGLAIPSVRRLASQHSIDLTKVTGTGKDGRVLKADVLILVNDDLPTTTKVVDDVIPITGLQRVMFESMTASLQIPTLYYTEKINIDQVLKLKNTHPAKPTVTAFVLRALALSLQKHTKFNSILTEAGEWLSTDLTMGCAMDTPRGLLVASMEVGDLSFVSTELRRLGELAKDNRIGGDDLKQPTFTLSNVGALGGGVHASPLLPPPLTAMCAMGAAQTEYTGASTAATYVYVTYAADHRVHDGASVARLSNDVKSYVESPLTMM